MDKQELKQAREEIAKWLHSYTVGVRQQYINSLQQLLREELSPDTQERWREKADQILAIKGIRIEAEDQSRPQAEGFGYDEHWEGYDLCEELMRKAGFVKVLPEKE